jgi:hypothetical protein
VSSIKIKNFGPIKEGCLENNAKFEYQKLNKLSSIIGEDYKIKLSAASSGFQSFVPLFLVSRYLANSLSKASNAAITEISIEESKRIKAEIEKIYANPNLSEEVRKASLEYLSSRLKYACFINIVEEPEQNLFPSSQRHILNKLLEFANANKENELIMTTHSPYIINYLTLAVKAQSVCKLLKTENNTAAAAEKINNIVPTPSHLNANDLIIYELDEQSGTIKKLPNYNGLPSDENQLNYNLEDTNELFAQLLEIQQNL